MLTPKFLISVISGAALALPLMKRDANAILKDIYNIGATFKDLINQTNSYDGTLGRMANVYISELSFHNAVLKMTSDVKATPNLSSKDCAPIYSAILGVVPDMDLAVTALKIKQELFASGALNLTSVVLRYLKDLKSDIDENATVLRQITSPDYDATARAVRAAIDDIFNDVIVAYSTARAHANYI